MGEWGSDGGADFALCMGAMTALAIVTERLCKNGTLDRDALTVDLTAAQDIAKDKRRIPLAMLQLLLELLESAPSTVL